MNTMYFTEIANRITHLKMYPHFDLAHTILCALAVRQDLGSESQTFSRKHPLLCWLSTIFLVFAGSMATNGLLGEPILAPLEDNRLILMATASWYIIFYFPLDIGYRISNLLPVKLALSAMKEVRRTRNIYKGIGRATELYPDAYLIIIIVGTVRGNGAGFVKLVQQLFRDVWNPSATEFFKPSFTTKTGFIGTIVIILGMKLDLTPVSHATVHCGIVIFFIYSKLVSLLLTMEDPFKSSENLVSDLLFGHLKNFYYKIFVRSLPKENKNFDVKKTD